MNQLNPVKPVDFKENVELVNKVEMVNQVKILNVMKPAVETSKIDKPYISKNQVNFQSKGVEPLKNLDALGIGQQSLVCSWQT